MTEGIFKEKPAVLGITESSTAGFDQKYAQFGSWAYSLGLAFGGSRSARAEP